MKVVSNDGFQSSSETALVPVPSGSLGLPCCCQNRTQLIRAMSCKAHDCILLVDLDAYYKLKPDEAPQLPEDIKPYPLHRIAICRTCYRDSHDNPTKTILIRQRRAEISEDGVIENKPPYEVCRSAFVSTTSVTTPKDILTEPEPTVTCSLCRVVLHKICVMYDEKQWRHCFTLGDKLCEPLPFICDVCWATKIERRNNDEYYWLQQEEEHFLDFIAFTPDRIKPSKLSERMQVEVESKLFDYCAQNGIPLPIVQIRELSSRMQTFEAKPKMKEHFRQNNRAFEWDLMQRSFMVFVQDPMTNNYTSVFSLIVQEYPSTSTVNVAYIDSVKLFEPAAFRTEFFKRVVISYLKSIHRKFKKLCIWVCPPAPGDEYVFFGRPPQMTHKPQKIQGLIQWYADLLNTCVKEDIIEGYQQPSGKCNPYGSYLDIPYLKDDFWVDKLESVLEQHENNASELAMFSDDGQRKSSKKPRKCPTIQSRVLDIIKKESCNCLFVADFKKKVNFKYTTITTITTKEHVENGEMASIMLEEDTVDILCDYMQTRDRFIVDCRENSYDYSDKRRAEYSTMVMLANIGEESFYKLCSECKKQSQKGMYCYKCDDTVFCDDCVGGHLKEHEQYLRAYVVPTFELIMTEKVREIQEKVNVIQNWYYGISEFIRTAVYLDPPPNTANQMRCQIIQGQISKAKYFHSHINSWKEPGPRPPPENMSCDICVGSWDKILSHKRLCGKKTCDLPICPSSLWYNKACTFIPPQHQDPESITAAAASNNNNGNFGQQLVPRLPFGTPSLNQFQQAIMRVNNNRAITQQENLNTSPVFFNDLPATRNHVSPSSIMPPPSPTITTHRPSRPQVILSRRPNNGGGSVIF